jgi:hypothetical protein
MDEKTLFQTTAIVDIDEQIKKEEELLNTIRMEPILEKTVMEEEPRVTKKKKMIKAADYILMTLIVLLSAAFVMVVLKVK